VTSSFVKGAIERLRLDALDTGLSSHPRQVTANPRGTRDFDTMNAHVHLTRASGP
jgi:hypothetical protein